MSKKLELYSMIQDGFKNKQRLRAETAEPGTDWRGGNSGCMTEDGIIIGASPRTTVLRRLGIEKPTTLDDDLVFEAGFKNEEHWVELLDLANVPNLQEEDIPIQWTLSNGDSVGGRPDIVIGKPGNSTFTPDFGVELKLISSNGKMMRHFHFGEANPSSPHVCQSAHYSSKLGVPWVIAYTNRAYYSAFYWGPNKWKFNKEGTEPHRAMLVDEASGKVIIVKPFVSLYNLTWDGDRCLIDDKPTIITASGIERFYLYCADCIANKIIPEHGSYVDIWGKREPKGSAHEKYDDFAAANTSLGFDNWVSECREIVEESK